MKIIDANDELYQVGTGRISKSDLTDAKSIDLADFLRDKTELTIKLGPIDFFTSNNEQTRFTQKFLKAIERVSTSPSLKKINFTGEGGHEADFGFFKGDIIKLLVASSTLTEVSGIKVSKELQKVLSKNQLSSASAEDISVSVTGGDDCGDNLQKVGKWKSLTKWVTRSPKASPKTKHKQKDGGDESDSAQTQWKLDDWIQYTQKFGATHILTSKIHDQHKPTGKVITQTESNKTLWAFTSDYFNPDLTQPPDSATLKALGVSNDASEVCG
jgi:hypothetical protein